MSTQPELLALADDCDLYATVINGVTVCDKDWTAETPDRQHQEPETTLRAAAKALRAVAQQASQSSRDVDALTYAKRLAITLKEKYFADLAPDWKPLDEMIGILTQIDNMTVGLPSPARMPDREAIALAVFKAMVHPAHDWKSVVYNCDRRDCYKTADAILALAPADPEPANAASSYSLIRDTALAVADNCADPAPGEPVADEELARHIETYLAISDLDAVDVRHIRGLLNAAPAPHTGDDVSLTRAEALMESQYLAGMKAGWNFGIVEDRAGYDASVKSRDGYLAALAAAKTDHPPHDPSGVISEPKGDSEMPGRRPRGDEVVPDERKTPSTEVR